MYGHNSLQVRRFVAALSHEGQLNGAENRAADQTPMAVAEHRSARTDKSVARANVRYFTNRLGTEINPTTRAYFQKHLVAEEDKLGCDLELIGEVTKAISNFNALIETQTKFVAMLEKNGDCSPRARALLDGLKQSKIICEQYHERIVVSARSKATRC